MQAQAHNHKHKILIPFHAIFYVTEPLGVSQLGKKKLLFYKMWQN